MNIKPRDWEYIEEKTCKCTEECKYKIKFYKYNSELVKIEIVNPYEDRSEYIVLNISEVQEILKKISKGVE